MQKTRRKGEKIKESASLARYVRVRDKIHIFLYKIITIVVHFYFPFLLLFVRSASPAADIFLFRFPSIFLSFIGRCCCRSVRPLFPWRVFLFQLSVRPSSCTSEAGESAETEEATAFIYFARVCRRFFPRSLSFALF